MLSNKRRIENQIDLILLILGELKGMRRGGSSVDNMNRRSEEAYIMKILSLSHTGGKENSAYRRSIKAIQIYPGGALLDHMLCIQVKYVNISRYIIFFLIFLP